MNSRSVEDQRQGVYNRFDEPADVNDQILTAKIDAEVVCFWFGIPGEPRRPCLDDLGDTVGEESATYAVVISGEEFELYRIDETDERMFQPLISGSTDDGAYLDDVENVVKARTTANELATELLKAQAKLGATIADADKANLATDTWHRTSKDSRTERILMDEQEWITNDIGTGIVVRTILGATLNTVPEYRSIPALKVGGETRSTGSASHIAKALESVRQSVERTMEPGSDQLANIVSEIEEVGAIITELLQSLSTLEVSLYNQEGADLVSAIETLVPSSERMRLGGYTQSGHGATLCSIYLQQQLANTPVSEPNILDPACGDGTTLAELAKPSDSKETKSLGNLIGVDEDPLAIELARVRIVLENLFVAPRNLAFYSAPFQSIRVDDTGTQPRLRTNSERKTNTQPPVDAIVMQPPMLRAEEFDEDDWKETISDEFSVKTSGRWDIAAYFLLHASAFLEEGGYLAAVVPTNILRLSSYSPVRAFLRENFDIQGLVRLDQAQTHINATVTVLYLRRRKYPNSDPVTLVDLNGADCDLDPKTVVEQVLEQTHSTTEISQTIPQSMLQPNESWIQYFEAPSAYLEWKERANVTLSSAAEIQYGLKTGSNEFFFPGDGANQLPDKHLRETIRHLPSKPEVVTSNVQTEPLLVLSDGLRECLHENYSLLRGQDISTKELLEECSAEQELVDYIIEAEEEGIHQRASLRSREPWFRLKNSSIETADVLVPLFLSDPTGVLWNDADLLAVNTFLQLRIRDEFTHENHDDGKLVAALLNTSLCKTGLYVGGSDGSGFAQINTQLLADLPIPNLSEWTSNERKQLCEAFDDLRESPSDPANQEALDEALQDAASIGVPMDTLRNFVWENS